jgi:hypothetical protein
MCRELLKSVNKISKILPEIEAARPQGTSGKKALCLLNEAIEKAKQFLKSCTESSKLYLVCWAACSSIITSSSCFCSFVVFMLKSLADKACNLLSDSNSEGQSLKMSKTEELFGAKFRRTSHYGSTRVGTRGS